MKCEFIEECPHAKLYVGRVCLHKAELCRVRLEYARSKELEAIFGEKGYQKNGITIRAFGKPDSLAIKIEWRAGNITFLSIKEVKEKAWDRSTFPLHIKELLNRIYDKFVLR